MCKKRVRGYMGDCPTEMLHQKMLPAHLDGDQDVGGPKQVQKCRCHAILKKKKKKSYNNSPENYRLSGLILVPRKPSKQDL